MSPRQFLGSKAKFRSTPGHPRLLWHPSVHQTFHEQCFIYLLSGNFGQGNVLLRGLEALFDRLAITSHTMNIVYGPYDALLRVWLDDSRRVRLLRALRQSGQGPGEVEIASYLEFRAEEIVYDGLPFSTHDYTDEYILALRRQISSVVEAEANELWTEEAERDLALLSSPNNDMPVVAEVKSEPGEKVFVFFTRSGGGRAYLADDVIYRFREVLTRLGSQGLPTKNISMYAGTGFCEFVVKFVAENYHSCLPIVQALQAESRVMQLQAWSLVVADYGEQEEGETVDSLISSVPDQLRPLINFAPQSTRSETEKQIAALTSAESSALAGIYEVGLERLSRENELERFWELLLAALSPLNRKGLNQILSFLTSIEGDLAYVIPRLAAEFGDTDRFRKAAYSVPDEFSQDAESTCLSAVLNPSSKGVLANKSIRGLLLILRDLSDANEDIYKRLLEVLGPEWRTSIHDIAALRNAYVHSRLTDLLLADRFGPQSVGIYRIIIIAIQLQVGAELLRKSYTLDNNPSELSE